ncbi:MAG: CocE/NonD family hydrolase [Mycobacterium sp.]
MALGVGTAIVTGAGVASAATGSDGDSPHATTSTSSAGARGATSVPHSAKSDKDSRAHKAAATHDVSTRATRPKVTKTLAATPAAPTTVKAAPQKGPSSSGNSPAVPIGPAADLLSLAGTRRETASATSADAAPAGSIGVDNGVITGCVVVSCTANPDGHTYTVVGAPSKGGKVALNAATGQFTFLPFAPEDNTNGPTGTESFTVLIAQTTEFDTRLTGVPLLGTSVFAPLIVTLQQTPVVNDILAPLIGSATTQTITADITALRGADQTPVAFTTMVTSFDGTQISTNFFPAIGLDDDGQPGYETMLYGPGLPNAGATDPTDPTLSAFRTAGYNVVTWDPRGEFASGGIFQLDNPDYEGRDVSQIITWLAQQHGVELTAGSTIPDDPQIGMVGISYGGGIQLITAANDHRVDAIAPGWAWNSFPDSLFPDQAFRTIYSVGLLVGLALTGAIVNTQFVGAIVTGALLGTLTPEQIATLAGSGPSIMVSDITAPTLLIQGTVDVLFPLQQSIINALYLTTPTGPDDPTAITKVVWFCGGHGACLPGQGDPVADDAWVLQESLVWMNRYVKQDGSPTDPNVFAWSDQDGKHWSSTVLPSDPAFYNPDRITSIGTGHLLPIIPVLGGSGPQTEVPLPYSLGLGSVASNAVNIQLTNPVVQGGVPVNVVGAPTVTMTYSGLGTSQHVYAQIVDKKTGLVVDQIVTPLPVNLDGQTHTQTYVLNDIAYTMYADSDLELQIVTSATAFLDLSEYGLINVGAVSVNLPVAAHATPVDAAV